MAKILVIEDEQDVALVLSKRLINEGYELLNALDAYQGYSLALKVKPDLIILDLMLPAGGGLTVLKHIRGSVEIMNTPVIVITGIKDTQYEQQVIKEGVEFYMEKPYDFDKLKAAILDIFKKKGIR